MPGKLEDKKKEGELRAALINKGRGEEGDLKLQLLRRLARAVCEYSEASKDQDQSAKEAAVSKAKGNALFASNDFSSALVHYVKALAAFKPAAAFLANRALCHLRLDQSFEAGLDGAAAVLLDATAVKGYHRLSSALLSLDSAEEAEVVCRRGAEVDPTEAAMGELLVRIQTAGKKGGGRKGGAKNKKVDEAKQMTEEEVRKLHLSDRADIQGMSFMSNLLGVASELQPHVQDKLGMSIAPDSRVAPFHTEFSKAGLWPPQCDITKSHTLLWRVYEELRMIQLHDFQLLFMHDPKLVAPIDMLKRLGSSKISRLAWFVSAPSGNVNLDRGFNGYDHRVLHSFNNTPCLNERISPGTTHVGVGFVDLGGLSASLLQWGEGELQSALQAPLKWVGYDASPYAIAKTLVIKHIIEAGAAVDDILQVWGMGRRVIICINGKRFPRCGTPQRGGCRLLLPSAVR